MEGIFTNPVELLDFSQDKVLGFDGPVIESSSILLMSFINFLIEYQLYGDGQNKVLKTTNMRFLMLEVNLYLNSCKRLKKQRISWTSALRLKIVIIKFLNSVSIDKRLRICLTVIKFNWTAKIKNIGRSSRLLPTLQSADQLECISDELV